MMTHGESDLGLAQSTCATGQVLPRPLSGPPHELWLPQELTGPLDLLGRDDEPPGRHDPDQKFQCERSSLHGP